MGETGRGRGGEGGDEVLELSYDKAWINFPTNCIWD